MEAVTSPPHHHALVWDQIEYSFQTGRLPQALLCVGPLHADVNGFIVRFLARIFCETLQKPCGVCRGCQCVTNGTHPDVHWVASEASSAIIKIDQIRQLQHDVHETPLWGQHRVVVIAAAWQLNSFAVNALLKLLEEPPSQVIFVLNAQHLDGLPETLISRCQRLCFPCSELSSVSTPFDYISLGAYYLANTSRGALYAERDTLIAGLTRLIFSESDACTWASGWTSYALDDVLWFLYLCTASLISGCLMPYGTDVQLPTWVKGVIKRLQQPECYVIKLFNQLDLMQQLMRLTRETTALNKLLLLERVLLGYEERA